jgi:PelA/Pel-15E family pectate lyase
MNNRTLLFTIVLFALTTNAATAQDPVAENMLMLQRHNGGWSKQLHKVAVNYNKTYSDAEKQEIREAVNDDDANIDNNSTTKEIIYLVKQYRQTADKRYLTAAERGIRYLLKAQYSNGGWPQYYPDHSSYRGAITFNDNAMINVLNVLQDVALKQNNMELVDTALIRPSGLAVAAGIDCILKCQVKNKAGKLTVWCAQHDAVNFKPVKARAFELVSLSGSESVGIVKFLMKQQHPSQAVKDAVSNAIAWFESARIVGYRFVSITDPALPEGKDKVLVADSNSVIWARFYDIETNEPFFCGRDGIKRKNVKDIDYERRNGYSWYGEWPASLLSKK